MKRLIVAMVVAMMVVCGSAMAGVVPSGECDNGCPPEATGQYTIQDMGEFIGGVWVWNEDFVQAADGQLSWSNSDWQNAWKPFVEEGGFHTDIYLMRRIYADPNMNPDSRVQVKAFNLGAKTKIPVIWGAGCMKEVCTGDPMFPTCVAESTECPEVYDSTIQYNFMMACDECGTGADMIQYQTAESTPTESIDVKSVEWDGVLAEQVPYAVTPHYNYMKYDTDKSLKLWRSYGTYDDEAVTYWHFDNKVPTAIGPVTLTVTLADDSTFTREINVTSVDDMPTISAFADSLSFVKVRPNGKLVAKTKTFREGVSVQNINIREILDPDGTGKSLVIQWPVPGGALFGSKYRSGEEMQLRLYVGKTDLNLNEEVFLFIDCPPQVGTVVIDAENYNWLKDNMTDRGMSLDDILITIFYRAISTVENDFNRAVYHNRGYSDKVLFTPVQ